MIEVVDFATFEHSSRFFLDTRLEDESGFIYMVMDVWVSLSITWSWWRRGHGLRAYLYTLLWNNNTELLLKRLWTIGQALA